jgi:hypothetical protein
MLYDTRDLVCMAVPQFGKGAPRILFKRWRHHRDVFYSRYGFPPVFCVLALRLCSADQRKRRDHKGLMFISLNAKPETQVAALDAPRAELEPKGVSVKDGSWATGCWWSMIPTAISSSSTIRRRLRNYNNPVFPFAIPPRYRECSY